MKKNKKIRILIILSVILVICFKGHASTTVEVLELVQGEKDTLDHQRAHVSVRATLQKRILDEVANGGTVSDSKATETVPSTKEEAISFVLSYLYEKIGEPPHITKTISSEIMLANLLMGETYFMAARKKYNDKDLTQIFEALREKTRTSDALKDFWPRIITMLAMNKMAHTPFFLPNRSTMIMRPFPPQLISMIDKELEATQFNSVNAILYWMRSNYYVKWVREVPGSWDVFSISRRVAIVNGQWVSEEFIPQGSRFRSHEANSEENTVNGPQSAVRYFSYSTFTCAYGTEPLVCNKHFPQEAADLFSHRTESVSEKASDFLVEILMAKYLSWLAKAEVNGKKYMSFYAGGQGKNNGDDSGSAGASAAPSVPLFQSHQRTQDLSGAFPGRHVYEKMVLGGFNQPKVLFEAKKTPYTADELSYQGLRYYVDAASNGLGTAIDYLRKRHPAYFAEHFIGLELEIADEQRAKNALYTLNWLKHHKVQQNDLSALRKIAGVDEIGFPVDGPKTSVMPPPSPRKTPAKVF